MKHSNAARFRKVSEVKFSEFSQKISDPPLVYKNDISGKMIPALSAGIFGFFFGITIGNIPLAFLLFALGLGLGGYSGHVVQKRKLVEPFLIANCYYS